MSQQVGWAGKDTDTDSDRHRHTDIDTADSKSVRTKGREERLQVRYMYVQWWNTCRACAHGMGRKTAGRINVYTHID